MGIILTSTGLPLLSSTGVMASPARAPVPPPKPDPDPEPGMAALQGPTSSISHRGVTFKFSSPVHWLASATGDPVVISHRDYLPSGTTISSISPASTTNAGGYKINGAMKNPVNAGEQGFDGACGNTARATYDYLDALNVDPANRGAIAIKTGDAFTIVKAVRDPGASDNDWKLVQKYVVLTVMASPPPGAGTWFRPSVSAASKTWPGRVEDIALSGSASPLRHLAPPSGLGNPSVYLAEVLSQDTLTLPFWLNSSESGRRMQLTGESASSSGYSRDLGRRRGEYACSLHIDPGADQREIDARRTLATILTQWGIDVDGGHQAGFRGSTGAGQWYGYIPFAYLAAFLLNDSAILARARAHASNSIGQCCWIGREIGYPVQWDWGSTSGSGKIVGETYQVTDLDIPEWVHQGWQQYAYRPDALVGLVYRANAHLHGLYRDTIFTTQIYELMATALLRNGFGTGMTGDAAIRDGSYGPGNIRSAAIAYMDRSVTFVPWPQEGLSGHTAASLDLYAAWRDTVPQAKWTGRPDIPQTIELPEFSASASAGQIAFDFSGKNYTTLPITDQQAQVSQDGRQFVDMASVSSGSDPGANLKGTRSGLRPGTKHWCRWRRRNGAGWSRWSPTWPMALPTGTRSALYKTDRGMITTTGAASGTLANSVAPVVLHKPYPDHEMPCYEPVGDATGVKEFFAGIGYWKGGSGAISASYQWQRSPDGSSSWTNVGTGASYTRTAADSGASIRCVVTVNGVAASSNPVRIPARASYPAGTLVDMTFDGRAPFDWPSLWAAFESGMAGAAPVHLLTTQLEPTVSPGLLQVKKTGSWPTLQAQIAGAAAPGTYRWEVEFGGGYFPASSSDTMAGNIEFKLQDASKVVRGDASRALAKEDAPRMISASGTFAIPASGDQSIHLYLSGRSGSGGGGTLLGGPVISRLKIVKVS